VAKIQLPDQLHICLVAVKFPILGRASDHGFLWPIARGLAQRGHKVTVIAARSPLGKASIERDGVKVHYIFDGPPIYGSRKFEIAALEKFKLVHAESPIHLVHSIDKSALEISKRKDEFNIAVAYDVDATQISQLFSILGMAQETVGSLLQTGIAVTYKFLSTFFGGDRLLLKSADGIFVTNPQQRIFLERYYLYPDFHTYTVPYGIDLGDLSPRPEALDLKKRLKLPDNAHIAMTITDMTEEIEVTNLLSAFEKVAVKKPNSYMIIVGNGPAWKEIEYHMLTLALSSRVIMTGALKPEEISDCISICETFVNMSSRSTGFEPAMIEAMAQKKIIIGSEVSPVSNIVEDGRDGFLLRPADTESLAHLLIDIFSGHLPNADIGERACEKVTNLFDPKKMVHSIEEAYQKILLSTNVLKKTRTGPLRKAKTPTSPSQGSSDLYN
jgi:1,2-diacylglycerol 3-alpha-glucosyltransferase